MPSILSHPIPALALAAAAGSRIVPPRLALAAVACALLPDLDVLSFKFGVRYSDLLGHRGLSHSLLFALTMGGLGALCAPWLKAGRVAAFLTLFLTLLSHIVLDAMTNGGLGVAFFWPFDDSRFFLPWRPIKVSPFSPKAFLSQRGLDILYSEFKWIWLPCLLFAASGIGLRRLWRK